MDFRVKIDILTVFIGILYQIPGQQLLLVVVLQVDGRLIQLVHQFPYTCFVLYILPPLPCVGQPHFLSIRQDGDQIVGVDLRYLEMVDEIFYDVLHSFMDDDPGVFLLQALVSI